MILTLCLALLVGTPSVSAQSFLKKVKSATEKVVKNAKETVTQATKDEVGKAARQTTGKVAEKAPVSTPIASSAASVALFGKDHTALFAPVDTAEKSTYGTKSVPTPAKPPKEDAKQPDWNDARAYVYEMDNQSLVDEYVMLLDCFESGYLPSMNCPASFRLGAVRDELLARHKMLERLVEYYNEAIESYGDEDNGWVADESVNFIIRNVLSCGEYKRMIRSSLAPLWTLTARSGKNWIKDGDAIDKYFKAHGGYENAHKAKWTVLKERKK